MRSWAVVPAVLLLAGAALVAWAAFQGGAQLAIVIVVPVLYGRSLAFVAGVLLLVAGLFTLPLAFAATEASEVVSDGAPPPGPTGGAGGFVVIGPVPIFFGSWKHASARTRLVAALLGCVALAVAILVLVLYRG